MGVGMYFINRICSSLISILMITQLFDPRGKRKKTNQVIYGTFLLEAVIILICSFKDRSNLTATVEVVLDASLFFAFYPLFYATVKQWAMTYLVLANITILSTASARMIATAITDGLREHDIAYCLIRTAIFAIWGIIIVLWGRDAFEGITRWKYQKWLAVAETIISCFTIPMHIRRAYKGVSLELENLSGFIFVTCIMIGFVIMCYFLYFILKEYFVKREMVEHDNNEGVLRMATLGLEQRIEMMDEYAKKLRVMNHDRRHFNAVLLEMLNQGEVEEAKKLLEKETYRVPKPIRKWCENETVNVAIGHYLSMAEEKGISLISRIDIPKEIEYDTIGLSMMLGNLIENAIHACQQIDHEEKVIVIKVIHQGQFIIEIENSCVKKVELDKNGYPTTKKMNHGYGTKSVVAFVKENNGEILYSTKENRFSVRIILP